MTDQARTDPLRLAFGRTATRAASRAQAAGQAYLDRFGVKLAYWPILLMLRGGGERTQVELAGLVERTTAAVSLIIAEMERAGLVARRPNPDNRREVLVALTPRGAEIWRQTEGMWRHVNAIAHKGLSGKEIALLHDLLARVIANFDADAGGA